MLLCHCERKRDSQPYARYFSICVEKRNNKCCVMKLFARFSITQLLLTIKLFLINVLFFLVKCFFQTVFHHFRGFYY